MAPISPRCIETTGNGPACTGGRTAHRAKPVINQGGDTRA